MMPLRTLRLIVVLGLLLVLGAGCAGSDDVAEPSAYTAVIDVRTPGEYTAGHIAGAQNIDVQGVAFDEQIAALPKEGKYLVYCRSGNRSAQAVSKMEAAGLTATNGGGLNDMTDRGYAIGN